MEAKQYKKGNESDILTLFEKAFSRKLPLAYWDWRFGNNPFLKPPMIDLMWEDDLLVGHYAVSAIEMNINGEKYLASLSGTTMTHPDYEGKGIFSKLALSLYDRVRDNYGVSMVLGYPNKNSHYGLVKKIEWKDVCIVSNLALNIYVKDVCTDTNILKKIDKFDDNHHRYINRKMKDFGFSVYVNRSAQYLNWRYLNSPVNEYDCFEYKQGDELKGIIITKKFLPFDRPGSMEIDIVEWICDANLEILKQMQDSIVTIYSTSLSTFTLNLWMSLHDPRHLLLERLGFKNGMPLTFMCTKAFINGIDSIFDARNWYVAMGDSDVF